MLPTDSTARARHDWANGFRFPPAVLRFAAASLAGAVLVAALSAGLFDAALVHVAVTTILFLAAALFAATRMARDYPHAALGLANVVTLARLGLTAALVSQILSGEATPWLVFALAVAALCLDGMDGWLARWQRLTSRFGAMFDMEVDAALGLVLALNALAAGTVGPAVLLLALPRYAFAATGRILPWMARPLPERRGRKLVCVLQIAALIALQLPLLGDMQAALIVTATALALAWSFGRDILWLWRNRP
ncbi:CDP-alcohol phosphatidyltransferase [Roseivivax lentus]|uniref:CDP-alcohol phosphatidyltransferase n=2 Tax=Roseivivax lentus TaxID=633194 RepID=A0A1N7PAL8_9RHOB|nr:CDP-alcohol phosphatidyltransferase [Roseivivax lentus]